MMDHDGVIRSKVDRANLPAKWPLDRHAPEFWEQLGRTVATFGFLEEVLWRAIFAFTGTRQYPPEEIQAAFDAWEPILKKARSDTLTPLLKAYAKAVKEHPGRTIENIDDLASAIKNEVETRNILCHGSWRAPDADGKSLAFFVDRNDVKNDRKFDEHDLLLIQNRVAKLACEIIDTVTHMGYQFPGIAGPGKPIYTRE